QTESAQDSANDGARNRVRAAYLRDIDGMAYGDDSDGVLVRGRQFIHPRLGFTFMVPTGFIVDNSAQSVLGSKGGGDQAWRLDGGTAAAAQSVIEFLNSGWIEGIRDGSVDELVVNGIPAATAVAASDLWTFRLYLMSFGGEVYRLIFAVKHGPPDNSDAAN